MDKECPRWTSTTSPIYLEQNTFNSDVRKFMRPAATQFQYEHSSSLSSSSTSTSRTACCRCCFIGGTISSPFYWFLARFSGRRRKEKSSNSIKIKKLVYLPVWIWWLLLASSLLSITEACSSRATPKPRPPAPTARPNITFRTYPCPKAYNDWYCLNGATCFSVIIGDSTLYNCECADGFMGPRCEFKDLDGTYLPSQHKIQLETASIAGGATIAIFLVVILCVAAYIRMQRRTKARMVSTTCGNGNGSGNDEALTQDCVDGIVRPVMLSKRVFGHHNQRQLQEHRPTTTFVHPWQQQREHLQRGVNTVALPMETLQQTPKRTIPSETEQLRGCTEETRHILRRDLQITSSGGDHHRIIAGPESPQQSRVV